MKKRNLFLLFVSACATNVFAEKFEYEGLYYETVSSDEVSVINKNREWFEEGGYEGVIKIPSTISYYGTDYKVTSISQGAFYHCTKLDSITIPDGITTIGLYAFEGCTGLKSLVIPESVTRIDAGAFSGCINLDHISVDSRNKVYDSRDNCNAIIESIDTVFYDYNWDGILYESGGTIKNSLLLACKNTTIPNSVTMIRGSAFSGIKGLTSIVIPPSVTRIVGVPSSSCSDLESITVHPDNEYYDSRDNCNAIIETRTNTLISGCQNTSIPQSVTRIGHGAFYDCSGLKSVVLPENLTFLGGDAFEGCSGLSQVHIPALVDSIGLVIYESWDSEGNYSIDTAYYNPFARCSNLRTITVDLANPVYDSRNGCNAIIQTRTNKLLTGSCNTLIPDGVTEIVEYAFWGINLTSIIIPESVRTIDWGAFQECTSLKEISLPDGLKEINDRTFLGCSNLISVSLPESIEEIGYQAFQNCTSLKSIVIPETVKWIYYHAFQGCTSLSSIEIPEGVTGVAGEAFDGCTGLTKVSIPSSLEYIYGILTGCENIDTIFWNYKSFSPIDISDIFRLNTSSFKTTFDYIVLGDSVKEFKDNGWSEWDLSKTTSLTVSFKSPSELQIDENHFNSINYANCTLYVPYGARHEYASTLPWSKFKNIVATDRIEHGTVVDGIRYEITSYQDRTASVIHNDYSGSVRIPSFVTIDGIQYSVTGIETEAFSDCVNLTDIRIPQSVSKLEQRTFQKCTALTDVFFEGSPEIEELVFIDCPNIQSVTSAGLIPGNMLLSNPFIGGQYENITVSSGTKYEAYDSTLMRNVTITEGQECKIQMYNIPEGRYKISVGLLPSPDSLPNIFHPIVNAYNGDTKTVLLDSVVVQKVEFRPGKFRTIKSPQQLVSKGIAYDSLVISDTLIIPEGYTKLEILLQSGVSDRNTDQYSSIFIIDRVFLEPLDNIALESYCGPFTESVFNNATLYVQEEAINTYRNTEGWKLFKNIAIDTGVKPIMTGTAKVSANSIIYDMTGRKVLIQDFEKLQPGLYIIDGKKYLKR